jgi:hypothetical protein
MPIQWEEPPQSQTGGGKYDELAEELRRNPGRWAKLGTYDTGQAANIRDGRLRAFRPAGAFEAVSRNGRTDGEGRRQADIYVRYVGEGGS